MGTKVIIYKGCEVLQDGILLGPPPTGFSRKDSNCNGDAFVELATEKDVSKAMAKHKQNIGSRLVLVSRLSIDSCYVCRYMQVTRESFGLYTLVFGF